jgi:hypothetical protein
MDEQIEDALRIHEPGDALVRALRSFLERGSHLLLVDANEQSITSLIARATWRRSFHNFTLIVNTTAMGLIRKSSDTWKFIPIRKTLSREPSSPISSFIVAIPKITIW